MIFLLLEMLVYLLLAAGIGGTAGWLLRNLRAQKAEESANRAANDAKSKLPQLESMVRSRDEQLAKFKNQLNDVKTELKERDRRIHQLDQDLRDQSREAKRWQQTAEARQQGHNSDIELLDGMSGAEVEAAGSEPLHNEPDNEESAELESRVRQLQLQLAESVAQCNTLQAQLEEQAQAGGAQDNSEESVLQIELDAARAEVTQMRRRLEEVSTALAAEQNKNTELQREQELQNKSLMVLHQQLELERQGRTASG